MTVKRNQIIETALVLFTTQGFDGTSTSRIAKAAHVSEGLIFRHFENKLGLLNAIIQLSTEKIAAFADQINQLTSPEEKIQHILELPFHIDEEEHPFWKLLYSIKWQNQYYDSTATEPLKDILVKAFKELKYSNPEIEAELILAYTDGFATTVLLKNNINPNEMLSTIQKKYKWILNK